MCIDKMLTTPPERRLCDWPPISNGGSLKGCIGAPVLAAAPRAQGSVQREGYVSLIARQSSVPPQGFHVASLLSRPIFSPVP